MSMDKNQIFRKIPKVDVLLEKEKIAEMVNHYGRENVMAGITEELGRLREALGKVQDEVAAGKALADLEDKIAKNVEKRTKPRMELVINATGTVLHTNLGRAPIAYNHVMELVQKISGYSNLEYDITAGKRGERYAHFEKLLCELTGAEAAMAVNNNASSVLLILNSLAKDKEAIVSRGELIEIGGKFRIPDVMEASGATMVSVGTTNKTHLEDYEEAITEETAAILKVHTSNYRIVGFTESVTIDELTPLAKAHDVPVVEDLGSGVLIDLSKYGLSYEPTVQDSVRSGADVVCFSGDKLLGGPQAGIIVGKKKYIDRMKKNQLTRALRIDKFTAAALELTLLEYLSEEKAIQNIPTLRMITKSAETVKKEAQKLLRVLKKYDFNAEIELVSLESQIGGGSLPLERLPGYGVAIVPREISVATFEERLRKLPVPIIARVADNKLLLDVRTIEPSQYSVIGEMLESTEAFGK